MADPTATACADCDSASPCDCAKDLKASCADCDAQRQPDQEFLDAVERLAVGGGRHSSSIFCYVLRQKDEIIRELREKVRLLNGQLAATRESGRRKRNRIAKLNERKLIVGTNGSMRANDGKELKGVPNYVQLHVHRTEPNMTAEDLESSLRDKFPEVYCEQILSRHPKVYSSFKISILAIHLNEAMDPAIWPEGAYVQKFINFKKVEAQ